MMEKAQKKLSRRLALICSLFAAVLSITLGGLGFYTYYDNVYEQYERYIRTLIHITKSSIHVEDMEECIQTGEKSSQYEKTQEELDNIKSQSEAEFIYVIRPLNDAAVDNSMYIWNAVTEEERKEFSDINSLGDLSGEGFPQEMAAGFMEAMSGGSEVTYIPNSTEEFDYVLTGLFPILNEDGEAVALIGVDILMDQIYTDLYQYLFFVILGTLLVVTVFLLAFLHRLNRDVTSPVVRMAESVKDFVAQSDQGLEPCALVFRDPEVHTGDEIQFLGESLKRMTSELIDYMGNLEKVTADKERISAELNVAAGIQAGMIPCTFPAFPERTEFDIYARMQVAEEMGGSFYDFFLVDQTHLALVMGEVGGRGIPAALLMVITRTLIKNYAQLGYGPAKVLTETNNQLSESNEGMTVTAFAGIIDLVGGTFTYSNGGHCMPLLKQAGKEPKLLPGKDCFVLGSMAGVPYWEQSVQMVQGDLLFLQTRGLAEAENMSGLRYSWEHMRMRMSEALGEAYELDGIARIMLEDVEEFLEDTPQKQDIAMLLFRFFGS